MCWYRCMQFVNLSICMYVCVMVRPKKKKKKEQANFQDTQICAMFQKVEFGMCVYLWVEYSFASNIYRHVHFSPVCANLLLFIAHKRKLTRSHTHTIYTHTIAPLFDRFPFFNCCTLFYFFFFSFYFLRSLTLSYCLYVSVLNSALYVLE